MYQYFERLDGFKHSVEATCVVVVQMTGNDQQSARICVGGGRIAVHQSKAHQLK